MQPVGYNFFVLADHDGNRSAFTATNRASCLFVTVSIGAVLLGLGVTFACINMKGFFPAGITLAVMGALVLVFVCCCYHATGRQVDQESPPLENNAEATAAPVAMATAEATTDTPQVVVSVVVEETDADGTLVPPSSASRPSSPTKNNAAENGNPPAVG